MISVASLLLIFHRERLKLISNKLYLRQLSLRPRLAALSCHKGKEGTLAAMGHDCDYRGLHLIGQDG